MFPKDEGEIIGYFILSIIVFIVSGGLFKSGMGEIWEGLGMIGAFLSLLAILVLPFLFLNAVVGFGVSAVFGVLLLVVGN
jgi:hypothetical protein